MSESWMSQVRLTEYGSEMIDVADNGSGIAQEDFQTLMLKYHTSKITKFEDLQVSINTLVLGVPVGDCFAGLWFRRAFTLLIACPDAELPAGEAM